MRKERKGGAACTHTHTHFPFLPKEGKSHFPADCLGCREANGEEREKRRTNGIFEIVEEKKSGAEKGERKTGKTEREGGGERLVLVGLEVPPSFTSWMDRSVICFSSGRN